VLLESEFAGGFLNLLLGRTNNFDDLYYLDEQLYRSLVNLRQLASSGDDLKSLEITFEVSDTYIFVTIFLAKAFMKCYKFCIFFRHPVITMAWWWTRNSSPVERQSEWTRATFILTFISCRTTNKTWKRLKSAMLLCRDSERWQAEHKIITLSI